MLLLFVLVAAFLDREKRLAKPGMGLGHNGKTAYRLKSVSLRLCNALFLSSFFMRNEML